MTRPYRIFWLSFSSVVVIVDQFIDRTKGRKSTFFGNGIAGHVAFADPVCPALAAELEAAAGPQCIGTHPESHDPIYVKKGRFGPYVQLGDADPDAVLAAFDRRELVSNWALLRSYAAEK